MFAESFEIVSAMMQPAQAAGSSQFHHHHHGGGSWLTIWSSNPRVIFGLGLMALVYGAGLYRLWARAGKGAGVGTGRAASFGAGWLTLVIALLSPLDAIAGELFAIHMIQHLLIILVAAPLVVSGAPFFVALWVLPKEVRRRVASAFNRDSGMRASWDVMSQPLLVWSAFFATLWLWHIPGLYEAALRSQLIHDIQHLGFMVAACMTWWILLNPMGRLRLTRGTGVLYLFTTALHGAALGVLLTFSRQGWYDYYEQTTAAWGLTLLQDQQIAGVIMWMPASLLYIGLAAWVLTLWIRESETADRKLMRFAASRGSSSIEDDRQRLLNGMR